MEFLLNLGLFSGKVLILVLALGALMILLFSLILRARQAKPLLSVENLNEKFDLMAHAVKANVLDSKEWKSEIKTRKKRQKAEKNDTPEKKRVFVLDFEGDIRASHVDNLREEITALLMVARPQQDEVVVRLESPGGMVQAYGLAAAQLLRVHQAGMELTICVDKMAASGGYMMACTANRIVAAPFAIIGSIGVVAEFPNFHRLLKKHDVDYEELTAGEFKRTLTMFGEMTEKGRRKAHEQIEETHSLFKVFVKEHRPQLQLEQVATGEYWFGRRALELQLVDLLQTSDEYLFNQIYKVEIQARKKWSEKLAENIGSAVEKSLDRLLTKTQERSFPG
jgi:serine protease SohB